MRNKGLYRKRRRDMRRKRTRNTHHIYPRSRGGGNQPENLVEIDRRLHDAYHAVFANRTPREAFEYASADFYGVACQIVRALVRQLGVGILDAVRKAA